MNSATNVNKVTAIIMIVLALSLIFVVGNSIQTYFNSQTSFNSMELNTQSNKIANANFGLLKDAITFLKNSENNQSDIITDTNQILEEFKNLTEATEQRDDARLAELKTINNNTKHNELTMTPLIHYNSSNSNSNNNTK